MSNNMSNNMSNETLSWSQLITSADKKNTHDNSADKEQLIEYKIEEEYYLNVLIKKVYNKIVYSFSKKSSYILKNIWERFLLCAAEEAHQSNQYLLNNIHVEDNCAHKFISECANKSLQIDMKLWNECINMLQNWKARFGEEKIEYQPIVDTNNTFIYKKFKKVLNKELYNRLLKLGSRESILWVLLRYDNICDRKYHMMIPRESIDKFIERNEKFIEGYASPLSCQSLMSDKIDIKNVKYCSLFNDTDKTFGSMGNIHDVQFSEFMGITLLLNPPCIETCLIACVDLICSLLSYANKTNNKIKILLAFPIWKDMNCYKKLLNHKNLIYQSGPQNDVYLEFYDYNGVLKSAKDRIGINLMTFRI